MSLTQEQWNNAFENGKDYTPLNRVFLANLLDFLELKGDEDRSVLDLGCGSGDSLLAFAEEGFSGTGIDFSEEALKLANDRVEANDLSDKLSFNQQDLNKLSADDVEGEYDIILSKLVYAFIADKKRFLKVVKQLTDRSGGTFVLITPVLFPNISYSEFLERISVPYKEAKDELEAVFETVEVFHENYLHRHDVHATFVCK